MPNIDSTTTSIDFGISVIDADSVGSITKIELLHGNDEPVVASDISQRTFTGLLSNNEYTVRITYEYDLNDGVGNQIKCALFTYWTAPVFTFTSASCVNTGPVSLGEIIYFEAKVHNPDKMVVNRVKINGAYYNVSSGTTQNSVIVNVLFDNQFEGGDTTLTVSEIVGSLNGIERVININDPTNATANVFVNGELIVKSISLVDEYGEEFQTLVANDKPYYCAIKLGNKTGYSIDRVTISNRNYTAFSQDNDENLLVKVDVEFTGWRFLSLTRIQYSNESVGSKSKDFSYQTHQTKKFLFLTSLDPIAITNAEQLKDMGHYDYTNSSELYKYYVLENDIDLEGVDWSPGNCFGYFDGQGHIIKNMEFIGNLENMHLNWGLFSSAAGIIENLRVSGRFIATINSTSGGGSCYVSAGAIAANNINETCSPLHLRQIASNVTISVEGGAAITVGGLLGRSDNNCIVTDSYSTGSMSGGDGLADGVCINCYFTSPNASETNGATRKDSIEEILAILKPTWDDTVWDFDNLDENGNPIAKQRYDITYNLNGGVNSRHNLNRYTTRPSDITLLAAYRKGYTFEGWYDNELCNGEEITKIVAGSSGAKTYYAKWQEITSTLSFNVNGGSGSHGNITITTGDSIAFEVPTLDGAVFVGWYTHLTAGERVTRGDGTGINVWACDDTEITLYARWLNAEYQRVDGDGNVSVIGQYILFGEYPQTYEPDTAKITGTRDERGYYLGNDGYYYAKVTATPYGIDYKFSDNVTMIESGKDYYFRVEPIKWRILSETDGKLLILCESIIVNKRYTYNNSNNYLLSEVRDWLNGEFYNTVFDELQKGLIQITEVDNSVYSTGYEANPYVCENTNDKIFLPSYREVTNTTYGFSSDYYSSESRTRKTSDYSRATGVCLSTSSSYSGNGWWLLRSPYYDYSYQVRYVNIFGSITHYVVNNTSYGVVPALVVSVP